MATTKSEPPKPPTKSEGTHKVPETKAPPKAEERKPAAKAAEPEPKPVVDVPPPPTPADEAAEMQEAVNTGEQRMPPPPEGYRWVLLRGEHCLAQTCPMGLADLQADFRTPGEVPGT